MDKYDTLVNKITDAVEEFIAGEELYDDDTQLEVNPATLEVKLVDGDTDSDDLDYYSIMDLVTMPADDSGDWSVDVDAVQSVAGEYFED